MTQFGDLKTQAGLEALNEFLASRSYIEGYTPSQADVCIFAAFGDAPKDNHAHCCRWYRHIKSYTSEEQTSFPDACQPPDQKPEKTCDDEDEDDFDIFEDEDEEEETEEEKRIKEDRVAAYHAKKSQKVTIIAKSSVLLDVKPWDDETDLGMIEQKVREIECDGLVWGQSKLVPLAYGIKKLQISCVIEDDKVSTDFLEEEITKHEDLVQSMDIAAFNKI